MSISVQKTTEELSKPLPYGIIVKAYPEVTFEYGTRQWGVRIIRDRLDKAPIWAYYNAAGKVNPFLFNNSMDAGDCAEWLNGRIYTLSAFNETFPEVT